MSSPHLVLSPMNGFARTSPPPPMFTPADTHSGNSAPAPQYRAHDDVWSHWEAVDSASKTILECQIMLADLESIVKGMTAEIPKLKENSSKLFGDIHKKRRHRLSPLKTLHLGSGSNAAESKDSARHEFEAAHRQETAWVEQIEENKAKMEGLKETIERNKKTACTVDQVFELLGASIVGTIPHSEIQTTLEVDLAAASASYDETQKLVTDFVRARVTVQHAHHYYSVVLKTIDSVRGNTFGRAVLVGLGEVTKHKEYKVAMETGHKADVCFAETIRVLAPYRERLPPKILEDFDALKEMGLLQASRIYELMYGWRTRQAGITQAVEVLFARQEEIYVKLTHLAVWVQDEVLICEAQLRSAQTLRDQRRRDLVSLWSRCRQPTFDDVFDNPDGYSFVDDVPRFEERAW